MRGWPSNMTSMTEVRPAMAPISTANCIQPMPVAAMPTEIGCGTLSWV